MVLVDREVRELSNSECGLIENYDDSCLVNIGYDLRTAYFAVDEKEITSTTLLPGESIFVASQESIRLPNYLLGQITLKNSRIRQGLSIDAPVYQPGHHTRVFFRLTNVSNGEIELKYNEKYATIIFEKLTEPPEETYNGTFREEFDFKGLADYSEPYKKQMKEIEKKAEDLKSMERSIYANVLVILTVFVALFSFLTTNVSLFSQEAKIAEFLIYNFIMLGGISFLVATLQNVIDDRKRNKIVWIAAFAFFISSLFLWWFA